MKFNEFLNYFPCAIDNFHFRFRSDDKLLGYIWQDFDLNNASVREQVLPQNNGIISAKILKLNQATCLKRASRLRLKNVLHQHEAHELPPLASSSSINNPAQHQSAAPSQFTQESPAKMESVTESPFANSPATVNSAPSPVKQSAKVNPPATKQSTAVNVNPPPASVATSNSLLDDYGQTPAAKPATSAVSIPVPPASSPKPVQPTPIAKAAPVGDLFEFSAPVSTKTTPNVSSTAGSAVNDIDETPSGSTATMTREDFAARREESIKEKVKSALEFKQEVRV